MPKNQVQHSRAVWEKFWREKKTIEEVYPNSERIVGQFRQLGDLSGKWIMEVGAGSGRDGQVLAEGGGRVIYLDYAKNSLRIIQDQAKNWGTAVYLVRGDAVRLPFKADVLDCVYHQGLLEHYTNPKDILTENYRVLKPGGLALADVPQRYHPYTVVKHILIWMDKWFAGWETEFSRKELEGLFNKAGFRIYRTYGDWMRPSFFYRAIREAAKKLRVRMPMYPKGLPLIRDLRKKIRETFRKSPLAFYTFMDIGVIGKK